jgi:hypothetical protein
VKGRGEEGLDASWHAWESGGGPDLATAVTGGAPCESWGKGGSGWQVGPGGSERERKRKIRGAWTGHGKREAG